MISYWGAENRISNLKRGEKGSLWEMRWAVDVNRKVGASVETCNRTRGSGVCLPAALWEAGVGGLQVWTASPAWGT